MQTRKSSCIAPIQYSCTSPFNLLSLSRSIAMRLRSIERGNKPLFLRSRCCALPLLSVLVACFYSIPQWERGIGRRGHDDPFRLNADAQSFYNECCSGRRCFVRAAVYFRDSIEQFLLVRHTHAMPINITQLQLTFRQLQSRHVWRSNSYVSILHGINYRVHI